MGAPAVIWLRRSAEGLFQEQLSPVASSFFDELGGLFPAVVVSFGDELGVGGFVECSSSSEFGDVVGDSRDDDIEQAASA